ncbi:MAG TPA: N-acetylglutaminylglutamine amidotransferase, partial [Caulobacteraceae bacterium]|nr:N-acetylglutaminylglutamine amidotransferase [Caulobacteraceae bacterium]
MSAIFGILRFDGGAVAASDLERMGATLRHRGPDGRKVAVEGPVGLGHCVMRVNQEDLFEAQPIRDRAADLTLVADCRIDNREELAGEFG